MTKVQIPKKLQFPNSEPWRARMMHCLEFGVWDLFGAWNLGFGALPACLGVEQTHSGDLPGVNQVPMNSHPNHEEFGARFRRGRRDIRDVEPAMSRRWRDATGQRERELGRAFSSGP